MWKELQYKSLRPMHYWENLGAMKAECAVRRITFDHTEVNPGETLYISVPKLNENEVIVPGSLALVFNLNVSRDANNFLVQNVWQALVDKFVAKLSGNILQDTAMTLAKSSKIFSFVRMNVKE